MKQIFGIFGLLVIGVVLFMGQRDPYGTEYTKHIYTVIRSSVANQATLGDATHEFGDLFLGDGGVIYLGNDQDVTITHVADTGFAVSGFIKAGSGALAGTGTFTSTEQLDTVVISGLRGGDIVVVSPTGTADQQDLLATTIASDTLFVNRPASGGSGMVYNYIVIKK